MTGFVNVVHNAREPLPDTTGLFRVWLGTAIREGTLKGHNDQDMLICCLCDATGREHQAAAVCCQGPTIIPKDGPSSAVDTGVPRSLVAGPLQLAGVPLLTAAHVEVAIRLPLCRSRRPLISCQAPLNHLPIPSSEAGTP